MNYQEMAISVTELNNYIKNKFVEDEYLNQVVVKGEISNFKHHYTGHMYFTLKDENCLVKCIIFKSYAGKLAFMPKEGMKVIILGSVAVFERDGVYQVYAKAMLEDGVGDLYTKYQQLKTKLEKKGMFDASHKKPIPQMPKTIGVLTSQTGSVIRDIINVATRRNPNVCIKLLPVPVQGEGAAQKIAEAIGYMNQHQIADVLILARGGGSLEDLWPFNEEMVAEAIFASNIPIISAVGHETDFTIADFTADLRAPTPSAAAELAVPDSYEIKEKIRGYQNRLKISLAKKLELMKMRYEKCLSSSVFKEPTRRIQETYILLDSYIQKMQQDMLKKQEKERANYSKQIAKLDALSPLKTLARGYSITEKQGKIIKSVKELQTGDIITVKMQDGNIEAKI